MSTFDIIAPILQETYGRGSIVNALASHLAAKLDTYNARRGLYASRQDMICSMCWDWMTGGGTAAAVAAKIEAALEGEDT